MKIDKTTGISIGTLLVVIPLLAGAAIWTKGWVEDGDDVVTASAFAGDVELSLQQIELELKMYRIIAERRALTPDEQDRKSYLEALRAILVTEQRKHV